MNIAPRTRSPHPEAHALVLVTLLTLTSALALLVWGLVSNQAYVVMLGVSIAVVAGIGWFLESVGVKQKTRGMA